MQVRFERREDGQVDARLPDEHGLLNEALADCISSLPPRGASGNGPSAYWLDVAERGARNAAARQDGAPFTWGNVTQLRVDGADVVASLDYDEEVTERMALPDFLDVLAEWRRQIIASAAEAQLPLPDTYRRNPMRE